jgi:hypothetical protein
MPKWRGTRFPHYTTYYDEAMYRPHHCHHTKITIVVAAASLVGNTLSVASLYTTTLY